MNTYKKYDPAELKKRLTPLQYEVTCNEATEPPFKNAYWDHKEAGIYVDVISGEALFSSKDKYDSGSGWPSFTKPIEEAQIEYKADHQLGVQRTEVRSKSGQAHLGHVFADGPYPNELRYCINSASLSFVPVSEMKKQGYEKYLYLFDANSNPNLETLYLAGGCFWGVEDLLDKIDGVIETEVGYSGGNSASQARYEFVKTGQTGHAETVKVVFDPQKLPLKTLLKEHFFKFHDPTTLNQQGNDRGTQYRSAIFYSKESQIKEIKESIQELETEKIWKKPILTQIEPLKGFYSAESYHQKYLVKNPGGYTCHFYRN